VLSITQLSFSLEELPSRIQPPPDKLHPTLGTAKAREFEAEAKARLDAAREVGYPPPPWGTTSGKTSFASES